MSSSAAWYMLGLNGSVSAFRDFRPWLGHDGGSYFPTTQEHGDRLQAGGCPTTTVQKAGGPLLGVAWFLP